MGVHHASGLVATLALVFVAAALPSPAQKYACGPAAVQVRDPPALPGADPAPEWSPPPTNWIFKPWSQVLTSNSQVAPLRNFQWDPTPVDDAYPEGPINDLSSFQLPTSDKVYTSYGVATPNSAYVSVLDYRGTGILENATSQYSWLGWGCDGNGNDYYLSYSSASPSSGTPAGIDFMSVVDTGLDAKTENAVVEALKRSQVEEVRNIANTFVKNTQDGGRNQLGRVNQCDAECKTNKDLIGVIG